MSCYYYYYYDPSPCQGFWSAGKLGIEWDDGSLWVKVGHLIQRGLGVGPWVEAVCLGFCCSRFEGILHMVFQGLGVTGHGVRVAGATLQSYL